MAAAVMGDDAIAVIEEEQHLRVPVIGRQRPAMAEHDGLTGAPVLVVNLGAVFGLDRRHGEVSSCGCRHSGTRRSNSDERASIGECRHRPKSPDGADDDDDEEHQHDALHHGEYRSGRRIARRQRRQRRNLEEALDDQHEHVEIKRDHRGHHIDPAPRAGKLHAVERDTRDRQQHQRQRADDVSRRHPIERKQEAGGAGQNREQQEYRGQARHPVGAEHSEHDDNARHDPDQADDHVHDGKCRQAHTQNHDALPLLEPAECYDLRGKLPHARCGPRQFRHARPINRTLPCPSFLHGCHNRAMPPS